MRKGVRDLWFALQFILSESKEVVGAELLVRDIRPEVWCDSYIFARAVEVAYEVYSSTGVVPHVNLYMETLKLVPYVYDGSFPMVLEVLEYGLDMNRIFELLVELKENFSQLMFALDDFGAGMSNFWVFNENPELAGCVLNYIKVDAALVPLDVALTLANMFHKWNILSILEKGEPSVLPGFDGYQSFRLHYPEDWRKACKRFNEGGVP